MAYGLHSVLYWPVCDWSGHYTSYEDT